MGGALKGVAGIALPVAGAMVGGPFGAIAGQAISSGINKATDSGPAPELNGFNQQQQQGSQPVATSLPASIPAPVSASSDQLLMSLLQNMRRV